MKRAFPILFALAVLLTLATATPVFATSPHFINVSASINSGGSLIVGWKEAGLGNNLLIHYDAGADSSAIYACINGGGNHPKAANKETVSGPLYAGGDFPSGKNGNVTASLPLGPLGAGAFSCPSGQKLMIAKVVYTNVSLWDRTNNIPAPILPGPYCKQFVNLPEFACP